ncbi:PREDICTED: AN1-type zinc finger protein 2A [Rhagoletis zephyria]|uniref:AN1-type zinc finger protein 2A n=1 Tax=Rhagoletis zephyria TaxID=28612 RepID=UPI0008113EAB|nr:PREDICTED: AN1-type zinc finger protein 2A [Rhagoletis zephyria]
MEFPHLGQHCNESTCNRLDFLPFKCDSCNQVYCSSHFNYDNHSCIGPRRKDMQVPICPLCGEPVPTAPGVEPDLTVGRHIDQQCKSDTKKIYTNRCSYKNCKKKELIPVNCTECRRNFCLRHRHTTDHECRGASVASVDKRAMAANAAEYRRTNKPTSLFNGQPRRNPIATGTQVQNIQGNMTEDEALARALALSIMELDENADRERRNQTAVNAAVQSNATVRVGGRDEQSSNVKDKCLLS